MPLSDRRTLLRLLCRLPIIAGIAQLGLFGLSNPLSVEYDDDRQRHEKRFQAVKILRLVNTAERWHFEKCGHYADLAGLQTSEAMNQLLKNETAEKLGIGHSLYSTLQFKESEIAPGWKLRFDLKDNRSGYVIGLDSLGKGLGAFASDQIGIIYEGQSLAAVARDNWSGASLVVGGRPIGSRPGGRVTSILSSLVFGYAVLADSQGCKEFPCCLAAGQQCEAGVDKDPTCFDCGCAPSCIYCCGNGSSS